MDTARALRSALRFAVAWSLAFAVPEISAQVQQTASGAARESRPAPANSCRPCTLAPQLLRKAYAQPENPMEVCALMFDLSAEQREQVARLAAEHELEMSRRAAEVDTAYVEKLGALLDGQQAQEFSKAMEALLKFRATIAQATAELAGEGGPEFAALGREGRLTTGKGLLRFLGLSARQNAELDRLEAQRLAALREGQKGVRMPPDTKDANAMREYREAVRAARAEADAQYEKDLAQLLTDAQREKLTRLEEAVRKFQERKDDAQRVFKRELAAAMKAD